NKNLLQIMTYVKVNYLNYFETVEVRMDSLYGPLIGKNMLTAWGYEFGTGLIIDGYTEYGLSKYNNIDDLLANPHDIYMVFDSFSDHDLGSFDKFVFSY
ncbi:MAG: hypothetical protein Q8942_08625, partial [Bacillota bacterium]|nr:hypothetical protein [Bacillota bacterium]